MVARISEFSSLYKFPMGRCEFALREVGRRARLVAVPSVAELADRGAEQASHASRLAVRASDPSRALHGPEADVLDSTVIQCLSAVYGYLDVQIRAYPEEPRGQAASRMARALMPNGVGAISALAYAEKHTRVGNLLTMAREPGLQADIQQLPEFQDLLDRLAQKNAEYGAVLHQDSGRPTQEDVSAARADAQDTLVEVFSLIVGLYGLRTPRVDQERDHLLRPMLQQNDALRAYRRRRRFPVDVDPGTGEELADAGGEGPPLEEATAEESGPNTVAEFETAASDRS